MLFCSIVIEIKLKQLFQYPYFGTGHNWLFKGLFKKSILVHVWVGKIVLL